MYRNVRDIGWSKTPKLNLGPGRQSIELNVTCSLISSALTMDFLLQTA